MRSTWITTMQMQGGWLAALLMGFFASGSASAGDLPPADRIPACSTPWLCKDKDCGKWGTGPRPDCRTPATKLKFVSLQVNAGGVVSNYVGDSGLEKAPGTSRILVPPWGIVAASIKDETEGWIAKEFTYDEVERWRNLQVLGRAPSIDPRSRRPELYGVITESAAPKQASK